MPRQGQPTEDDKDQAAWIMGPTLEEDAKRAAKRDAEFKAYYYPKAISDQGYKSPSKKRIEEILSLKKGENKDNQYRSILAQSGRIYPPAEIPTLTQLSRAVVKEHYDINTLDPNDPRRYAIEGKHGGNPRKTRKTKRRKNKNKYSKKRR